LGRNSESLRGVISRNPLTVSSKNLCCCSTISLYLLMMNLF
jgi:hypothetical protein